MDYMQYKDVDNEKRPRRACSRLSKEYGVTRKNAFRAIPVRRPGRRS